LNLDRLSLGEKLLGASALLLFVLSFLGFWVKVEADVIDYTDRHNAWSGYGFLLKLALILALAAAVLVIARAADANLTLQWGQIYKGLAGATLGLLLIQFLVGPEEGGPGLEISRGILLFVGLLLAVAMAAGAWLHSEPAAGDTATTA
jgi:hypothetical protein